MIHLIAVTKIYFSTGHPPHLVLSPTTMALPDDRRVAILGERGFGKTTLLQLISGVEAPTEGKIVVPVRVSPVINTKGWLLHPRMTGLENLRFIARVYGTDPDRLALAADAFGGIGHFLPMPLNTHDADDRRVIEFAVMASLPFDCYLLDHMSTFEPELVERFFIAAASRKAGVIFTTRSPRAVRQYADFVAVIADHTVRGFNNPVEAIDFYEREKA